VIEVLASNAENQAHNLRQVILRDGKLSRAPTAEEWDFLKHLHKKYGYGERHAGRLSRFLIAAAGKSWPEAHISARPQQLLGSVPALAG
jgi:hypothetical protein